MSVKTFPDGRTPEEIEWVKIQVVRHDGQHEVLILTGPISLRAGEENGEHCIVTATGMEHFFRFSDGVYTGWARAVSMPLSLEGEFREVSDFAAAIESEREIVRPEDEI
jgi:hypothetical protein